jgi:Na+/H+ antiporter NhaD/arsenite permease-like protein
MGEPLVGKMLIPLIVLAIVFILIAVRNIGKVRLEIWQIMLAGAVIVMLTGQIAPIAALRSINLNVLLFLASMFLLGSALEDSGLLLHASYKLFRNAKSADQLVLLILFGTGIASAVVMNDTLAIIGTPLVIMLARRNRFSPNFLLLALAFAVTIGSVMSPLGNPQNFLIGMEMANPFVSFARLILPTMLCLIAAYLVLRLLYRREFGGFEMHHTDHPIKDQELSRLAKICLGLLLILVVIRVASSFLGYSLPLTAIAPLSCLPLLLKRPEIIKRIDWKTLVFFASMFVLMQSVWETGFFQNFINASMTGVPAIMAVSILVSQAISNVPLVTLYLPMLSGEKALLALAAGSTIAGNLLILGAASNVIIIQNAEKHKCTIGFLEFARAGIPLTTVCALIYLFMI